MEVNCSAKFRLTDTMVIADLISWLNKLPPGTKVRVDETRSGEMGLKANWDEER